MKTFECRICGPDTPVHSSGAMCGGCGTPIANAEVKRRKKTKAPKARCPRCERTKPKEKFRSHVDGTLICDCGVEFDPDADVTFCDARPDVNAEKRDEYLKRLSEKRGGIV